MMRIGTCLLVLLGSVGSVQAEWPFFAEGGLRRGSPEYYEARAGDPPGTRQKYRYGKLWPVRPRPVGPEQTLIHKYHSAHYWPFPYICADRAAVRQVMDAQVFNGWQTGTTLYDYHFDPVTHELNTSGMQHLQWMLTHTPEQFRQAHVAVAADPEFNSVRMMNVEREVARLAGDGSSVPVLMRVADPLGRPAAEVQFIMTTAQQQMMPPVIKYTGAGEGGSN